MKISRLPPLTSLRAFDAVARHESFKRAAEEISVTPTAISHQIRSLEQSLECRLFERSAKGVSLTPQGVILFRASATIFSTLHQAVSELTPASSPGALTLSTTSNFLTHWLIPRLPEFQRQCPGLNLHLHTAIDLVDPAGGIADCAIRYSQQVNPALDNTLLCRDRFMLVASPQLAIRSMQDLLKHTLFHVDNRHIPRPSPDWQHWKRRFGPESLDVSSGIHFNDETHAIQAAIAGQGVLIASELLVRDALQKKILVSPSEQSLEGGCYYFVTSENKAAWPEVRQLRQWLLSRFAATDSASRDDMTPGDDLL